MTVCVPDQRSGAAAAAGTDRYDFCERATLRRRVADGSHMRLWTLVSGAVRRLRSCETVLAAAAAAARIQPTYKPFAAPEDADGTKASASGDD